MQRALPALLAPACVLIWASGMALGRQAAPDGAAAQPQDGPVIVGARRGVYKPLEFRSLTAAFELEAKYYNDEQTQSDGTKIQETESRLRNTLDLGWEASIGHKNLIDFVGNAQLGFENISVDSDTEGLSSDDTQLVTLYDLQFRVFQESDLPFTVYTRRDEVQTDRQFAGTIESTNSETGVIASLRSDVAPTTFQYFHREVDQTDPLGTTDYHQVQDSFNVESNVALTDLQQLEIDYTFDTVDEEQGQFYEDNFDRNDGTFTHQWYFDDDRRDNLRSSARVYTQTGLVPQDSYRLDEQLRLYHTDRFDTHYDATIEDRTIQGQGQQFARGLAGFRHKLFESLVSTGNIGASRLDVQDVYTSDSVFATLGMDYTKKVPMGRFEASLSAGFETQDNSDRGSAINVLNEPHTFNDPFPVVISRRNIVESSIRVTALAGFPEYQEGIDYTVDWFPDRVELTRVVGGAIADGETVLVSYEIGPEPGNTIDTNTQNVSLRYVVEEGWLTGISPYLRYRRTDQSISADDPSQFVLDDVNALLLGIDYRLGGLYLKAEWENYDSTVQPYDSTRLEASYIQRFSRDSALRFSATSETIDYSDDGSSVELNRLSGRWTQRFDSSLELSVDFIYRDENDRDGFSTRGLEEGLELNWRRRQTSVFFSVRNSDLDGESTDTTSQSVIFGFRREF